MTTYALEDRFRQDCSHPIQQQFILRELLCCECGATLESESMNIGPTSTTNTTIRASISW